MEVLEHSPTEAPWLIVTDGTSQEDRYPAALRDGYFQPDERTLADMLSRTSEFAKEIRYYNTKNERSGDWRELFARDDAVTLAQILATDTVRMEAEFVPMADASHAGAAQSDAAQSHASNTAEMCRYLARFARRIDLWYRRLPADEPAAQSVGRALADWQMKRALLDVARGVMHALAADATLSHDRGFNHEFAPVWGLPCRTLAEYTLTEDQEQQENPYDPAILRLAFYTFVHTVTAVKRLAKSSLDSSLGSGNHDPAMAVFIAFAQLFETARERVNRFTGRHRDFFYRDLLGIGPRPGSPDSVFLAFENEPPAQVYIPAGTGFKSVKAADGTECIYTSDTELTVTDCRVASILTLQCQYDPRMFPEGELSFASALLRGSMDPVPPVGSRPPLLFGNDASGDVASAGFAVACRSLLLSPGNREITVTLHFRAGGDQAESTAAPASHAILNRIWPQRAGADAGAFEHPLLKKEPGEILQLVFGRAFLIDFTSAAGWYSAGPYRVSATASGSDLCVLSLIVAPGPDAPSLAPWNEKAHGSGFGTEFPVLRFRVNPDADIYPWSLLEDMIVEEAEIRCSVTDDPNTVAWNQQGRLDTSKPFLPFGPLPGSNAWLVLGNFDCARMGLTDLRFHVEWGDLPGNLADYYSGYANKYGEDVFVANLSVLSDGSWMPAPNAATRCPLFSATQTFTPFLADFFEPLAPNLPEEQFLFDQKARNGFFRVALAGPAYGFGQSEYSALVTRILSENAQNAKWWWRDPLPLPNPPYTPLINRLTADYSALSSLTSGGREAGAPGPAADRFYRIHPFGTEPVDTAQPWALVPSYPDEGTLFIGLAGNRPGGRLTLFIQLREDSTTSVPDAQPVVWYCLIAGQWLQLAEQQIESDTTQGFLTSGIVTLLLPDDFGPCGLDGDYVMPAGLAWLRLSAPAVSPSFQGISSIRAHAVSATRSSPDAATSLRAPTLPAFSIKEPAVSIPGLRTVSQPLVSRNGQAMETPEQTTTRAAGRVRHRYRASTPWDYERLVLENFPDVYKVKCFPSLAASVDELPLRQPGSVMVVVVPYARFAGARPIMDPMISAIRLKSIRDFLISLKSPFANIEVRNPEYEQVMVSCGIGLRADAASRRGLCTAQIQQAIADYISPWNETGLRPRFGWTFTAAEMETFIRRLDCVQSVTDLALIRIARNGGAWQMEDTARRGSESVSWGVPWSLANPAQRHDLNITAGKTPDDPDRPRPTGIGNMEIGRTFILTQ